MTLEEFSALKVRDKISNPWTDSVGEVTEVTDKGVRVVWGERHPQATHFFYSIVSTSWMQWTKARRCSAGPCTDPRCDAADQCLGGDYDKIIKGG